MAVALVLGCHPAPEIAEGRIGHSGRTDDGVRVTLIIARRGVVAGEVVRINDDIRPFAGGVVDGDGVVALTVAGDRERLGAGRGGVDLEGGWAGGDCEVGDVVVGDGLHAPRVEPGRDRVGDAFQVEIFQPQAAQIGSGARAPACRLISRPASSSCCATSSRIGGSTLSRDR